MRSKITGAIGFLLGVFMCLPAILSSESGGVPWPGLILICLGVYYMFFKHPPLDDKPDIEPENRFKDPES